MQHIKRTAAILGILCLLYPAIPLLAQDEEGTAIYENNKASVISFVAMDEDKMEIGRGSGFMIGKDIMVTNYNLVSEAKEMQGYDVNGKKVKIDGIISIDLETNLAVLKAKSKGAPLQPGSFANTKYGDTLHVVGGSEAGDIQIYSGTIINLTDYKENQKTADTSISAPDTASGAPVFDKDGQMVGILMFIDRTSKFVMPAGVVNSLKKTGKEIKFKKQEPVEYFKTEQGVYLAARLFTAIDSTSKAERYLREYLVFHPDDLDTYVSLADVQTKQRDYDSAIASFQRILELDPSSDSANMGMGSVYIRMMKWSDAIPPLEKAIQLNPDNAEVYAMMGKAYKEQRTFDKAAEAYKNYLNSNPASPGDTHFELGECYMEIEQFDDAVAMFQQAVEADAQNMQKSYKLGQAMQKAERYDEAAEVYYRLAELSPDEAKIYYNTIVRMYDDAKLPDKALEAAQRMVELEPNNHEAIYNLGAMYLKQEQYTEAAEAFTRAIEINPSFEFAYANLGYCYSQLKNYKEAIATFQRLTEIAPDNDQGWFNLGINYMQLKRWSSAVEPLQKTIELKPSNGYAYYNLGIVFLNLKDNYSAKDIYNQLLKVDPNLAERLRKYIK